MSYMVLARKWRPKVFEEIRGQGHIVRALTNAIRSGRIAHAYIFTGTRGVGKTSAARVFAKALNCVHGPTPEPCNKCDACIDIAEGRDPDVLEIDGASNNSVDDVRRLREIVSYAPVRGKYRIYIIDEVHMLSGAAFNALLKTLEEPPPHVVFIFATTDPKKVPVTILSRCQEYDFKSLSVKDLTELLGDIARNENIEIEEKALISIAREAQGSVRDGQSLLDQVISYGGERVTQADVMDVLGVVDRQLLLDIARVTAQGDARGTLEKMRQAQMYGLDVKRFALDMLDVYRDMAIIKEVKDFSELVDLTGEEALEVVGFLKGMKWEDIHARFDMLAEAVERIRTAPKPSVVLEMALLKMAKLPPIIALSELGGKVQGMDYTPPTGPSSSEPPRSCTPTTPSQAAPSRQDEPLARPAPTEEAPPPPRPKPTPESANADTLWKELIEQSPLYGKILCDFAKPVAWDGASGSFTIQIDPDHSFIMKSKAEEMGKTLTEAFGRRVNVNVVVEQGVESSAERAKRETDVVRKKRQEAMDHPVIKRLLELTGGEIEDIKALT